MKEQIIVIKLGSSVLTAGGLELNEARMRDITRQCKGLKDAGYKVIIVSSGAIAAGKAKLDLKSNDLVSKQVYAAVGQNLLFNKWKDLFGKQIIAQMLLTRADLENRKRFLNARDLLLALLKEDIIPIINENDAVATAEIKVGDNDNLSSLVAILAFANKLFILSDIKGLYENDPKSNPNAKLIKTINKIDESVFKLASPSKSALGTGGMITKLEAAKLACAAGIGVYLAAGSLKDVILRLAKAEQIGTFFKPKRSLLQARKSWILGAFKAKGELFVDDGARLALINGASLLAGGILRFSGEFDRADGVSVYDANGSLIAKGICSYSKDDLAKILKNKGLDFSKALGYEYKKEIIHRNDLVLI